MHTGDGVKVGGLCLPGLPASGGLKLYRHQWLVVDVTQDYVHGRTTFGRYAQPDFISATAKINVRDLDPVTVTHLKVLGTFSCRFSLDTVFFGKGFGLIYGEGVNAPDRRNTCRAGVNLPDRTVNVVIQTIDIDGALVGTCSPCIGDRTVMVENVPLVLELHDGLVVVIEIVLPRIRQNGSPVCKSLHGVIAGHVVNAHATSRVGGVCKVVNPVELGHVQRFEAVRRVDIDRGTLGTDHVVVQTNHSRMIGATATEIKIGLSVVVYKDARIKNPLNSPVGSVAIDQWPSQWVNVGAFRGICHCDPDTAAAVRKVKIVFAIALNQIRCVGEVGPVGVLAGVPDNSVVLPVHHVVRREEVIVYQLAIVGLIRLIVGDDHIDPSIDHGCCRICGINMRYQRVCGHYLT